ncbi:MAG: CBS domain-containing protein [Alphaproteobacteria bacterium]|jgi:CBS domain-containing protein
MIVREILKSKGSTVLSVPAAEPLRHVATLLHEARIGAVIVHDDHCHPVGILSERDIVSAIAEQGASALDQPARSVMTADIITCTPDDHIDGLMQVVTERRVRHLPVLDADGDMAGIISIGDLVKARIGELEREKEALRTYINAVV